MENRETIRFDGEVAVVTGAGNGLGRSYAHLLAARGARVVVNDFGSNLAGEGLSHSPAETVVAEIGDAGGVAVANYEDVRSSSGCQAIIDSALSHFGRLDILICNAGIWSLNLFEDVTDEIWRNTLGVHLDGTMFAARAAWPVMKAAGYGRIVLTSSSGGLYGKAGLTAYAAAKGGIFGLMQALSLEAPPEDIRVNTILPGAATRMISEKTASLWQGRPGMGDPAHVAALVAVLASRQCGVNGRAYSAGGGYYARDEAMLGAGTRLDPDRPASPEEIMASWPLIDRLTDPAEFDDVMAYGASPDYS